VDAHAPRQPLSALAAALAVALACAGCGAGAAPAVTPTAASAPARPARFVDDDYPGALARARREGKLLFVDAWAPWCHSCLSLRAYVLGDPALGRLEDRWVFASVDTEREGSRAFVERFRNTAWPTLWVIDPATEEVVLAWAGTTSVDELVSLLADVSEARAKKTPALVSFVAAAHAAHDGHAAEAARLYRDVLTKAPSQHLRARALEGLVTSLSDSGEREACVDLAQVEGRAMPRGASFATVIATGLGCAGALPPPRGDDLARYAEEVLGQGGLVPDDASGVYEALVELRGERHDAEGKRRDASAWASFLEARARDARDPAARAVFDPHRVEAYLALDEPARAIPMLEASARDFPRDYNPHARLARVRLAMKDLAAAEAAYLRASALVYGPRTLRVAALGADVAEARGDRAAAQARLRDALAKTEAMPLNRGQAKLRAALTARLAKLEPERAPAGM